MKNFFISFFVLVAFWAAVPWTYLGIPQLDRFLGDYKLGLDLHGGVELDYLVDFSSTPDLTTERRTQILEDMKTILDGRVRRIGTTEPTLNNAYYGEETHIIVQIPTPSSHDKLEPIERQKKDAEFIEEAKAVIGQVIKIQFKEPRPENEFDNLLKKRGSVVSSIDESFLKKTIPFDAWGQKVADNYENVFSFKTSEMQALLSKEELILSDLSALFPIETVTLGKAKFIGKISGVKLKGRSGVGFVSIESFDGKSLSLTSSIDIRMVFVDNEPLEFRPALGKNGKVLNEKQLISTLPSKYETTGQFIVNLVFNDEGRQMFGDITERNIGKSIAIFLGNNLITNANVSSRIDGDAIITMGGGGPEYVKNISQISLSEIIIGIIVLTVVCFYLIKYFGFTGIMVSFLLVLFPMVYIFSGQSSSQIAATELSKSINEGIVPVGIYEHSEKTIGPNLGKTSLKQLVTSGILGLILMCLFLLWRYRASGIVAGASLVIYVIVLLGLVRLMGVTLTLSGVAGIVLSIGIAIDSNILLLERVRDFLKQGKDMKTSLKLGFHEAWSAVWDSNLTGLFVGLILWWMGVSLVKGFGQMSVLGIIVSLLVLKYICNPLTIWLRNKIG